MSIALAVAFSILFRSIIGCGGDRFARGLISKRLLDGTALPKRLAFAPQAGEKNDIIAFFTFGPALCARLDFALAKNYPARGEYVGAV
ncbi:hypothetical protein [Variovorax sp. MHTC-1]|uniref:hypothetical protein n=1 Tax=Variovorax sp. MHTC-1 TaxID=2495593 RepID=UPI000F87EF24|nr:hypothetical protein [Variovorax sp. MHTC-1]RST50090.1 hypothetical protein EJI01_21980 [Variovorax sp. MHTC-1]